MSHAENVDIKAVLDLYGFAVDTQRWDLFDQVFTPDVKADYGGPANWSDLATLKRDFATYHDIFDGTHHVMTNLIADVRGDVAKTVVYGHWLLIRRAAKNGDFWRGQGWYDDELVRSAGGWRIKTRRASIIQWEGNLEVMTPGGVDFAMDTTSLRAAANAERVPALIGLQRRR